jgi:hypothetical protein
MTLLVTLEGVPHTGRQAVLRCVAKVRPAWKAVCLEPSQSTWQSLLRKIQASKVSTSSHVPGAEVVVMGVPWFERLPRHPALCRLLRRLTRETVPADAFAAHVMVHLRVPHHESFEQLVGVADPHAGGVTLEDVRMGQVRIAQELLDAPAHHPFPCASFTVHCPPFFDDNEASLLNVASQVVGIVDSVLGN